MRRAVLGSVELRGVGTLKMSLIWIALFTMDSGRIMGRAVVATGKERARRPQLKNFPSSSFLC